MRMHHHCLASKRCRIDLKRSRVVSLQVGGETRLVLSRVTLFLVTAAFVNITGDYQPKLVGVASI